jgi:hypothetical protein
MEQFKYNTEFRKEPIAYFLSIRYGLHIKRKKKINGTHGHTDVSLPSNDRGTHTEQSDLISLKILGRYKDREQGGLISLKI